MGERIESGARPPPPPRPPPTVFGRAGIPGGPGGPRVPRLFGERNRWGRRWRGLGAVRLSGFFPGLFSRFQNARVDSVTPAGGPQTGGRGAGGVPAGGRLISGGGGGDDQGTHPSGRGGLENGSKKRPPPWGHKAHPMIAGGFSLSFRHRGSKKNKECPPTLSTTAGAPTNGRIFVIHSKHHTFFFCFCCCWFC